MASTSIQTAFASGEISPSLWGRIDLAKWHTAASTMRNMFVSYRGGACSRAGTAYVGMCKQGAPNVGGSATSNPPRDIPFQFSLRQGYALEFGDYYMRVKYQGAYVTEPFVITSISQANPVSVVCPTQNAHGTIVFSAVPSVGDTLTINGVVFTFVGSYSADQYKIFSIAGDLVATLSQIKAKLNACSNGSVNVAAYTTDYVQTVTITYNTGGAGGNAFTLAASNATVSGTTLTGGGAGSIATGDWLYFSGVGGMTQLNNRTLIATGASTVGTATSFNLTDLFGTSIDTTWYSPFTSGGTVNRIYTLTTPWAAVDLPYLKFTQSADTMSLCCVNQEAGVEYPPYDLVRNGATDWALTQTSFGTAMTAPTGLTATATSSTTKSTYYSYVVTAVSSTGEESVASSAVSVYNNDIAVYAGSNALSWTAVTGAACYNVYKATPSYSVAVPVGVMYGFCGKSPGPDFTDTNITADFSNVPPLAQNPFSRGPITQVTPTAQGTGYSQTGANAIGYAVTTSTGSGFAGTPIVRNGKFTGFYIQNGGQNYASTDTITILPQSGTQATCNLTWVDDGSGQGTYTLTAVTMVAHGTGYTSGTAGYKVTTSTGNGIVLTLTVTAGQIASVAVNSGGSGYANTDTVTFTGVGNYGSGATASLTIGKSAGTYPAVVGYFQQRRVYADTLNTPDTYYMSQPGAYKNFDSAIPTSDADAITGTPWAQQINGVQWMVPMPGGLVVLTGKGAWQLSGGSSNAITPADQFASPQAYNGCSATIPPIAINYDIMYVQAKGSIVRDLAYNYFVNIYTGTDVTVMSNHLFSGREIVQWAYSEEPDKIIWCILDNGTVLSLTCLKEQDIYGWARHDTFGLFQGVCSITEPPIDAVYFITKRYVRGNWVYYSERMDDRFWQSPEDAWCVDCGLSYPQTNPAASLTASAASETITLTASSSVFSVGDVGSVIRMGGGIMTITAYTSGTVVTASVTQAITETVPNDPNNTPIPVASGAWSISVPTSTVTGLDHLEGLTVSILGDGNVMPSQTVTNGAVTLPHPCSAITIGLPFTAQLQTPYLEPPGQPMTSQGKRKSITAATIRVEASRGFQVGTNQADSSILAGMPPQTWGASTGMKERKERGGFYLAGQPLPLFTGDARVLVPSDWQTNGQVAVQQTYPLPLNVLAVIPEWTVGDSPG